MTEFSEIPTARRSEYDGLVTLLLANAASADHDTRAAAECIARAAIEDGHLWRAMRLESRDELRAIFRVHFPELYEANDRDMRWKKFLYKRLCGWEGFSG